MESAFPVLMTNKDNRSIEVKKEAVGDFVAQKNEFMKGTIWEQECRSW
jgi:hypothetical protein